MHRLLPALALLSGVSGIAYEVLYVRLLSAYVGNIFYVSAVLLSTFLFGIALGSFIANAHVRRLKYIELGIGTYAFAFAGAFAALGLSIPRWLALLPIPEAIALPLFVFMVLILPAVAIGFSVPLFAHYIDHHKKHDRKTFGFTYFLYNIGAAVSVLGIEYVLIWNFGISSSICVVAIINILIGGLLFEIEAPPVRTDTLSPDLLRTLSDTDKRSLIALAVISTMSGIVQLNLFSLFHYILGPLNENFALLIGASLISISIAAVLARSAKLTFSRVIALATVLTILPLVFLPQILGGYMGLYQAPGIGHFGILVARSFVIALIALPAFIAFGLTIPALVRDQGIANAGLALAVASAGNALGYLVYTFLIFNVARHLSVVVGVGLVLAALLGWHLPGSARKRVAAAILLGAVVFGAGSVAHRRWPSNFYVIAYHDYKDADQMARFQAPTKISSERRFGSDSIVTTKANGDRELLFNGYRSLTFSAQSNAVMHETLVGAVAAFFSEKRERALVFGLGTGITAGAAAASFKSVVVAEINPTMGKTAALFAEENDHVLDNPAVSLEIQDGLITLLSSDLKYDAIINTVPSPRFFSANKLWTRDVFLEAKRHLRKGGVFVGWLDGRLGLRGTYILRRTLDESFAHCVYVYLVNGYFAFVCSAEALSFRTIDDGDVSPVLVQHVRDRGWQGSISSLIRDIVFSAPTEDYPDYGINTIDHPLLEFEKTYDGADPSDSPLAHLAATLSVDAFTKQQKPNICAAVFVVDSFPLIRDTCPR